MNKKNKQPTPKATADGDSMEEELSDIREAFREQFNPAPMEMPMTPPMPYVCETYPDYMIVSLGEEYFKVGYTVDPATETYTFDTQDQWQPVKQQWVNAPDEGQPMKAGARHNQVDQKEIQAAHDAIVQCSIA